MKTPSTRHWLVGSLGLLMCLGCGSSDLNQVRVKGPVSLRVPTPLFVPASGDASEPARYLYVPVYSHIYVSEGDAEDLAITLSVRNLDVRAKVELASVRFNDTAGAVIQDYLDAPVVLGPLQTVEFFVRARDQRGGSGANFVVAWHGEPDVRPPLTEAVMVRAGASTRGYAFTTRGVEISASTKKGTE
jgi:hypothetical protein